MPRVRNKQLAEDTYTKLVVDSGSTASGNVYVTLESAVSAAANIPGKVLIEVIAAPAVVNTALVLDDIVLKGKTLVSGVNQTVTLSGTSTITSASNLELVDITLQLGTSATAYTVSAGTKADWRLYGTSRIDNTASVTPISITGTGSTFQVYLHDTSSIDTSVFNVVSSGIFSLYSDGTPSTTTTVDILDVGDGTSSATITDLGGITEGTLSYIGTFTWNKFDGKKTIGVTTGTYNVSSFVEDLMYEVDTSAGGVTLNLPATTSLPTSSVLWVKDVSGSAGTNNITINQGSSTGIDGSASLVLADNYAGVVLKADQSNNAWVVLAQVPASGGGGAHAATHISGGADVIDGDQVDITWSGHTNYTPSTAPTEVTSSNHLTAHLAGIDTALASAGGGASPAPLTGIITNGLVFAIDSADRESWDGSTTVTDIISGDTATASFATGNPAHFHFSSTTGTITFSTIPSQAANLFAGANGGTVIIWARMDTLGSTLRLIHTATPVSSGWSVDVGTGSSSFGRNIIFYTRTNGFSDSTKVVTYEAVPLNSWCQIAVTHDNSSISNATIYVNTSAPFQQVTQFGAASGDDSSNQLVFSPSGKRWRGDIGVCLMYDRMLSQPEIAATYEYLKHRYELPEVNTPAGVPKQNLQLYVDYGDPVCFNQQDTVVRDMSPNKAHGVAGRLHSIVNGHYNLPGASEAATHFDNTGALTDLFSGGGTVFAWFRPETDGEGSNGGRIVTTENTIGSNGWGMYVLGASPPFDVRFIVSRSSVDSVWSIPDATDASPSPEWVCAAFTYDSDTTGTATAYLNGEQVEATAVATGSGTLVTDSGFPLIIGDVPNSASMFDGDIEIVALYDRALNAEEIRQLYAVTKDRFVNPQETTGITTFSETLQTGNGVLTTIAEIPTLQDDSITTIEATIVGSDGANNQVAMYKFTANFYRDETSTVSQKGTTTVLDQYEDVAGWDFALAISGTKIQIQVQGAASTTVNWRVRGTAINHG